MFRFMETLVRSHTPPQRHLNDSRLRPSLLGSLTLLAIASSASAQSPQARELFEVAPVRAAALEIPFTGLASLENPTRLVLAGPRSRVTSLLIADGNATAAAVGPDGFQFLLQAHQPTSRLAAADSQGRVAVWIAEQAPDKSTAERLPPVNPAVIQEDFSRPVTAIAFDATGELVLVARAGGLLSVSEVSSGQSVRKTTLATGYVTTATGAGPSGDFLIGTSSGELHSWGAQGDAELELIRQIPGRIEWIDRDVDSQRLTIVDSVGGIHLAKGLSSAASADDAQWTFIPTTETGNERSESSRVSIVARAGADRIAIGFQTGRIRVRDLTDLNSQTLVSSGSEAVTGLAFDEQSGVLHAATGNGLLNQWVPARPLSSRLTQMPVRERRIWSTTFGHATPIFVVGGDRGLLELWNPETGQLLRTLQGATRSVDIAILFNEDQRLATCSLLDTSVLIWNTATGELLGTVELPDRIRALVHHSASGRLVAGCRDGTVLSISGDFQSYESISADDQDNPAPVSALASDRGSNRLAVARGSWSDQTVTALAILEQSGDAADRIEVELNLKDAHRDTIRSLIFSSDGTRLYSADQSGVVCVWNVSSRTLLRRLETGRRSRPLQLTPSGDWLLIGHQDGTVSVLDQGNLVIDSRWDSGDDVFGVAVDAQSRWGAIVNGSRTVQFWALPRTTPAQRKVLLDAFPSDSENSGGDISPESESSTGKESS